MAWTEVLSTATYTSPSGKVSTLNIDTATQTTAKQNTTFTFPGIDGAYVQDLSRGGRVFPVTAIFHGADYNAEAGKFVLSLEEVGQGKLEHPVYGSRIVVPTGSVSRKEGLVEKVGFATVSVSFAETFEELTFPVSSELSSAKVTEQANTFQSVGAEEFAKSLIFDTEVESTASVNNLVSSVKAVAESLQESIPMEKDIATAFSALVKSFTSRIQGVTTPIFKAASIALMLIRTPARVFAPINTQIDGFGRVIANFIGAIEKPDGSNIPFNRFTANALLVRANFVALCESMLYGNIRNRPEAVYAAVAILDINKKIQKWTDENITSLEASTKRESLIDIGESYNTVQMVVSSTVRYLIDISFGLPLERKVVLQDDRQVLELLQTLGLSVDKDLDFFIQSNSLTADTIEVLPAGMEVVYYV